jgi:hypothetical protein
MDPPAGTVTVWLLNTVAKISRNATGSASVNIRDWPLRENASRS